MNMEMKKENKKMVNKKANCNLATENREELPL